MGQKRWHSESFPAPLVRELAMPNSPTWFFWKLPGRDIKRQVVVASEEAYSPLWSRFLRIGDLVRSTGEYAAPKGTVGVLLRIEQPFTDGHTDYVYQVAFDGHSIHHMKSSHLMWEKSQRIRPGKPNWFAVK